MGYQTVEKEIGGLKVSLETGRLAKQASGSSVIRLGDTMVLTTACSSSPREDIDFFPLSVDFIGKTYAAGKIPGGFFKREGKPPEKDIISARLVDRPIRPLFPEGYRDELQIISTVISADETYDADVLAITGASCSLSLSNIPFQGPIAGVRVGMVDGKPKVFPTLEETEAGELDMIVAGSKDSIMMVEGGAFEIKEELLVEAILLAHEEIRKLVELQEELVEAVGGKKPIEFTPPEPLNQEICRAVEELVKDRMHDISFKGDKQERYKGIDNLLIEVQANLAERFPEEEATIAEAFHEFERKDIRSTILEQGVRIGGRDCDTIRNITCDLDILPRAHGSALFTRGETQSLVVTTLGTKLDEQKIDNLQGEYNKSYMLHYNFPPYSVGETKRLGAVSRREVGHGHLAERSLSPVLPSENSFPYTIRVVSEILESNGSSSMASVCGGSLSLMAAAVPIKTHVAGVAMGLIKEDDKVAILTDILGTEDHLGDMDFKIAGTRDGITAIQMDIKIDGITAELMKEAVEKARVARLKILDIMFEALPEPRKQMSEYAPRIFSIMIDKDKIRDVIGPGGKMVREIQETSGVTINIEDSGKVVVYAADKTSSDKAIEQIKAIACDPEIGDVFEATVKNIADFGAFVEYLPGREGLVHISELEHRRVNTVDEVTKVGEKMQVKVTGYDRSGKIRLSRKALIARN
ncbi:MAG: polyribonucleotide nucleotidyltransferase [Chitinivibrionales bacterium]|nr:polyribonucleotide nucleotidyltransferase [Chitinivibrionales bacterium]